MSPNLLPKIAPSSLPRRVPLGNDGCSFSSPVPAGRNRPWTFAFLAHYLLFDSASLNTRSGSAQAECHCTSHLAFNGLDAIQIPLHGRSREHQPGASRSDRRPWRKTSIYISIDYPPDAAAERRTTARSPPSWPASRRRPLDAEKSAPSSGFPVDCWPSPHLRESANEAP